MTKDPIFITPRDVLVRLTREVLNEQSNIKREPDLRKRRQKFHELGNKFEFMLRILPELNACLDVEWGLINGAIETVEKQMAEAHEELRNDGEGWKSDES